MPSTFDGLQEQFSGLSLTIGTNFQIRDRVQRCHCRRLFYRQHERFVVSIDDYGHSYGLFPPLDRSMEQLY